MKMTWRPISRLRFAVVAAVVGLALLIAPPARSEDRPKDARGLLAAALDAARKAPQGDKECVEALEDAVEGFADEAKVARETAATGRPGAATVQGLSKLWNASLTALYYHGEKPKHEYILVPITTYRDSGISLGMPVGGEWSYDYTGESQHVLSLFQKTAAGKTLCHVKVWSYRWDTTYSGVGGENCKKLAKVMLELDRDSLAKSDRKASTRVTAKRLNSEFSRAQYYYVEGFDVDEEARLRRSNYYIKDVTRSYNVEVIEYLDPVEGEDAITAWRRTEEDPEREAMLQAIAPVEED